MHAAAGANRWCPQSTLLPPVLSFCSALLRAHTFSRRTPPSVLLLQGVMLTHSNLLYQVNHLDNFLPVDAGDRTLSLLPPWHIYERACGCAPPSLLPTACSCTSLPPLVQPAAGAAGLLVLCQPPAVLQPAGLISLLVRRAQRAGTGFHMLPLCFPSPHVFDLHRHSSPCHVLLPLPHPFTPPPLYPSLLSSCTFSSIDSSSPPLSSFYLPPPLPQLLSVQPRCRPGLLQHPQVQGGPDHLPARLLCVCAPGAGHVARQGEWDAALRCAALCCVVL